MAKRTGLKWTKWAEGGKLYHREGGIQTGKGGVVASYGRQRKSN